MKTFLWVLAIIGAWNGISMIARICYRERWNPYLYHVLVGIFAAYFLWRM